ncbi:MAG: hypothetical protein CMO33_09940 [Verrucomicrobia bacterium]|nr:hypothetical protein [Verrucomicrobiota bacterium]
MILNDVITEVRRIIQDTNTPFRYSDDVLLGFANQALKRIAVLRPDLFAFIGDITCTDGEVVQSTPSDSIRLIEIYSVKNGNGIIETNREALDQAYPTWMNDTAAAAVNFMRHVRNPNKFFIYPKAPAGQILVGEYAKTPPEYTGTQTVELIPDAYFPVVIDATVFIAESVDNEHVNSNRAQLFQQSFTQALGVAAQSRAITDPERGGLQEEDVV